MKHIFIVGCKGIPANYGGFETFVDELVTRKKDKSIQYHVACMGNEDKAYMYHGAHCFQLKVANIGPAKAVAYDLQALNFSLEYIKTHQIKDALVYILACRIGPFMNFFVKRFHQLNVKVYVNPDGHEWKRAKWNKAIREYWKKSEALMVKHADKLICDSSNIEAYIQKEYQSYHPNTCFIAYGADTSKSTLADDDQSLIDYYHEKGIKAKSYYLVVGRFVPENNYETMIREFMKSNTTKDFVIITNVEKNQFYEDLRKQTHFDEDARIKFVGTLYDQQLLKKVRENAYAYFHGHEVGGTNPSLLEALATTSLNLLLKVGFNEEVGLDSALYWNKEEGNLAKLIDEVDSFSQEMINDYDERSSKRIEEAYLWDDIVNQYESELMSNE